MGIQPLVPQVCPHCEAKKSFIIASDKLICQHCGHTLRKDDGTRKKPAEAKKSKPKAMPRRKFQPSYRLTMRGEINQWAKAAYDTGQDYIRQEKWDDALKAFHRALDNERDFLDAHLWIARLSDDPQVQEEHLTNILAHDPNHMEALQELMVLRGELDPSALDAKDPHAQPVLRDAGGIVATETQNLRCKQCNSPHMTFDHATLFAKCDSCGYVDKEASGGSTDLESLTMALLKRKTKTVVWKVGSRLLHCNSCGAERTLPSRKLSERCPFCGSNHVILQDALESFEQPDGIVRFKITREQAAEQVKSKLEGWSERFKGLFDNNKVDRATIDGVYLPFWAFDTVLDVRRSVFSENTGVGMTRDSNNFNASFTPAYQTETIGDAMNNVLIPAVTSPPHKMIDKMGKFDLKEAVGYNPKLLAKFPAELYSIDFDKASLEARGVIGEEMRLRHGAINRSGMQVNIFTSVTQMTFRLYLLPVWVATLYEEDGDVRTALINGQSGQAGMGKTIKPK